MSSQVTEIHEERIQRLEGSMEKVVVSTATTSVKVDHLVEAVEKGFANVNARLDAGSKQFDDHATEIAALKTAEKARSKRWEIFGKATIPVMAVILGAIGTKFGESIYTWLAHLFGG